ncbi:MAG: DUF4430 domain-containing protein [Patescibacteria group bacterium]|nr:DUF4430 domain-containing protein [Patescibacteria group bacterium]
MKNKTLFGFIIIVGIISFVFGAKELLLSKKTKTEIASAEIKKPSITPSNTLTPSPTQVLAFKVQRQITSTQSPTITPSQTNNNTSSSPAPTNPPAQSTAKTFEVFLSVPGSSNLSVILSEGSNQCDVLSKAKEQGKIQSLNMKYDSNYGSYGVYQINGIGKENAVWWVYSVNGTSPNEGCSKVKANPQDKIEWKYLGS